MSSSSSITTTEKRCLTSFNCHATEHCDMKSRTCVPNASPGDRCNPFVKMQTCANDLRCNLILKRCVSDKEPSWIGKLFGLSPYTGYPENGCGRDEATSERGCLSMECRSEEDCSVNEFCGAFVDENGNELPFNPSPKSDSDYLSVQVISKSDKKLHGFCIQRRTLNQYCTSSEMCEEGLGCDLAASSKCKILCFSNEDCKAEEIANAFPNLFNESNSKILANGQCKFWSVDGGGGGFCQAYIKADYQPNTSVVSDIIPDGSDDANHRFSLIGGSIHPYYILLISILILIFFVLSFIWCCGSDRETYRISRIRKQQRDFVRLARSGATPSSNIFTSGQEYQAPSASYPWNNPSKY